MARTRRKPKDIRESIMTMLGKRPQGMSISSVSTRLQLSSQLTSRYLKKLRAEGRLERAPGWAKGWRAMQYRVSKATEEQPQ